MASAEGEVGREISRLRSDIYALEQSKKYLSVGGKRYQENVARIQGNQARLDSLQSQLSSGNISPEYYAKAAQRRAGKAVAPSGSLTEKGRVQRANIAIERATTGEQTVRVSPTSSVLGGYAAPKTRTEIALEKTTPSGYRTVSGRTQTVVSAERVTPVISLSPRFAGRVAGEGISVTTKPSTPFITPEGRTTPSRAYVPSMTQTQTTPREEKPTSYFQPSESFYTKYEGAIETETERLRKEQTSAEQKWITGQTTQNPFFVGMPTQSISGEAVLTENVLLRTQPKTIVSSSQQIFPTFGGEKQFFYDVKKEVTPSEDGTTLTTYYIPKEGLQPKEFGGIIAGTKLDWKELNEQVAEYGLWKPLVHLEAKKISPAIETFFEVSPEQLKAREESFKQKPKTMWQDVKEQLTHSPFHKFTPEYTEEKVGKPSIPERIYIGGVQEFLAKPVTRVAPALAMGSGFVATENIAFGALTRVPYLAPAFEALTTPTGYAAVQTVKAGVIGLWAGSEIGQIYVSPDRWKTFGGKLFEVPTVFAGGKLTSDVFESQVVRRGGFGSPVRRYEEVAKIKSITEESKLKAVKFAKEQGLPVSPELETQSAAQVKLELREASDVVWSQRGVFKPEIKPVTVEEFAKVEKVGSKARARKVVRLAENFDVVIGGSTAGQLYGVERPSGKPSGDVDLYVGKPIAFGKVSKKLGVEESFDVHSFGQLGETATAQLEPIRTTSLPSGKEQKVLGFMELKSRKVEGAIRFFTGEEAAVGRGKDLPDVLAFKKRYSEGEKLPVEWGKSVKQPVGKVGFEWKPASKPVVWKDAFGKTPEKVVVRYPSVKSKVGYATKLTPVKVGGKSALTSKVGSKVSSFASSLPSKPSTYKSYAKPSPSPYTSRVPSPSSQISKSPSSSSLTYISKYYGSGYRGSYSYGSGSDYSSSYTYVGKVVKLPNFGGGGSGRGVGKAKLLKKRYAPSLYGSTFNVKAGKMRGTFTGFEIRGVKAKGNVWAGF